MHLALRVGGNVAKPQCENGYTRIANELLDAFCKLHLSGNQWMVLHTIIRKTYGWNKKEDWITGTQIAQITGLRRQRVYEALKALQARRVILRDGKLVGIQKDYTFWLDVTEKRYAEKVTGNRTHVTEKRVKKQRKSVNTKDKRPWTKDGEQE